MLLEVNTICVILLDAQGKQSRASARLLLPWQQLHWPVAGKGMQEGNWRGSGERQAEADRDDGGRGASRRGK